MQYGDDPARHENWFSLHWGLLVGLGAAK